jgi:hypothetical protein
MLLSRGNVHTIRQIMNFLSTQQVADEIGIAKRTLLRWIYARKLPEVRRQQIGGIEVRLWNRADLQRARRFKQANYRKHSSETD